MTQQIKTFQLDINEELLLNADPTANLGAVTKQYVDNATGSVGQVSLVSAGNTFGVINNGTFFYQDVDIISPGATIIINLPLACNLGTKVLFKPGHDSVSFISLTTTQLQIKNNDNVFSASANWLLIAL